MKIDVTIDRLRHGRWVQHAKGKFPVDSEKGNGFDAIDRWIREKGVPDNPARAPGWAIRVACLP